jgi:hypothetical protein
MRGLLHPGDCDTSRFAGNIDMSTDIRNPQMTTVSPAPEIARDARPIALTQAALDHVTAAGSKPGMVGDGRQSPSLSTRYAALA